MIERSDKLNNQAILLASDGSYQEAIACFKRAIVIDKENSLLWYNLGVTYRDAGNLVEAEKSLATAFMISPENMDIEETYATICLMQKDLESVREICVEGLDYNPLHSHLFNLLGVVEFQSENYDEAAEYFEEAVHINPYYLDALYNLKDTYSMLNNKKGEYEVDQKIKEIEK
ncbi:MAG: tetratricopeptide repeat protein [Treponema sp.]|nr:tetratricopeptide repeat protein [Treponema sp.]MCI6891880.1 tetratricopeptide repeat protein [Treponema sp.]MCI7566271.1 tetratricopeptide repeat protein [Treponema sp.]